MADGERAGDGLTGPQRVSVLPDASIWLSASAGTGKTYVLTARALRLMLDGVPPDKILCLTFTKAAAAEMSNRIYQILGEWVGLDDTALDAAIYARTDARADAAMRARARALFAIVVDLPGGLRISTFHAFCQSMLGRFPLEAGLSPHFQVLDETAAGQRIRTATMSMLQGLRDRRAGELMTALQCMATQINEGDFEKVMTAFINDRHALDDLIRNTGGLAGAKSAIRRRLDLPEQGDATDILKAGLADTALDRDGLHQLAGAMAEGSDREQQKAEQIARLLACAEGDRPALYEAYRDVFLKKKDLQPQAKVANKPTLKAHPELADVIDAERERIFALEWRRQNALIADNAVAALHLAAETNRLYQAHKRTLGGLDYEDLILFSRRLLARPGIAPWILFKLDGGIDHILVDEAQDTNSEQWQVIEAIAEDFFSGESAREATATMFAVGDVKQSIYRFQRADPDEFDRARDRTRKRATGAGLTFKSRQLTQSFRSVPAVLKFVDAVFAPADMRAGLTGPDEEMTHDWRRGGEAGLVELWDPEPYRAGAIEQDGEGGEEAWPLPTIQQADDRATVRLANRIAERIATMLDGEALEARGRPVRPGDIMVLVRRRNEFVDALIRALKVRDIPVAGNDRMKLTEHLAVMDLIALGHFALMPEDDLTLAVVLKSPLIGFDDDDLFALAHGRDSTLWQALSAAQSDEKCARAYRQLATILARADQTTPFEFFARVLNEGGGRKRLLSRLGAECNDPIDEFLERAVAFERMEPPSLQGFLHWIASDSGEVKRDMEQAADEVRVMTVHGAKGLEAPIVFLPDTCQARFKVPPIIKLPASEGIGPPLLLWPGRLRPPDGPVAEARERELAEQEREYRRLLYVAMTRAQDRLYIAGWETNHKRPQNCWYNRIEATFDRLDDAIETRDAAGRRIRRFESAQTAPVKAKGGRRELGEPPGTPEWLDRPAPAEPAPPRPLAPSRTDDVQPAAVSPQSAKQVAGLHRGRLIHRLLEVLPDLPKEQQNAAAERFLARDSLGLCASDRRALLGEVKAILDDPALAPLFGPDSRAEVPLTGVAGGQAIAGQVDRLAVTEKAVWIVDYKTNRPPPQTEDDVPASYIRQMAAYRTILAGIFPDKPIHCTLLWTDVPRLMTITPARLDAWQVAT